MLLYLSWQFDYRCGAKAAESKLAQGPDRQGSRSFAIASALGKVARLCVLDTPQLESLILGE